MKRTYPANIDGQVFYIDEDAFMLLQNYLQQLKQTFGGEEGREIVADIESRIRELFNERIAGGAAVITLADVNKVIETMGRPEELSPEDGAEDKTPSPEDRNESGNRRRPFVSINLPTRKKLFRNMQDKVFGGVIGGLATYLGWNATIMRLLFVVLVLCTKVLPFVIVYLLAWMIIPPALTPRQKLLAAGAPVNVNTVGQAVIEDAEPTQADDSFRSIMSLVGKCIMAFVGVCSIVVAIGCLIGFIAVLAGVVAFVGAQSTVILTGLELFPVSWYAIGTVLSALLFCIIFFGAISWGSAAVVFSLPRMRKTTLWTLIITTFMLLTVAVVLGLMAGF